MPSSLKNVPPILNDFIIEDSGLEKEDNFCGECDYCDLAAQNKIKKNEPSGALFCKEKQIRYETLDCLQLATFSKYLLNTGAVTSEEYEESGFGFGDRKSQKSSTMIVIPSFLSEIFKQLRRAHEEELEHGELFISVVHFMNVRNVRLNAILDLLIRQDLNTRMDRITERQKGTSDTKALETLKSLNAFELFSLIVIFLNRLPSPVWRLTAESSKVLLELSDELPLDANTMAERKEKFMKSVLELPSEDKMVEYISNITEQIHDMFDVEGGTRSHYLAIKNQLFFELRSNLGRLRPRMRRNIIRVVVRNFRFELSRHIFKLFKRARNITHSPKEKQSMMDTIFACEAANLAFCCGPAILRLYGDLDTRENRVKAMTSLLFHFDGSIMYRLEKDNGLIEKTMSCHSKCPCGFGELYNVNDPAFRNLYIGEPFLVRYYQKKEQQKKSTTILHKHAADND